jgi:hypothetical protein
MDDREFADTLTLCQFMPRPNIVGITVCVGCRLRGSIGAITAVAGFILLPWTVGLFLGGLYFHYAHLAVLQKISSWNLRCSRRADDGDRLPASDGAWSPGGAAVCRARPPRHGAHQATLLVVLLGLAPISVAVAAFAGARRTRAA